AAAGGRGALGAPGGDGGGSADRRGELLDDARGCVLVGLVGGPGGGQGGPLLGRAPGDERDHRAETGEGREVARSVWGARAGSALMEPCFPPRRPSGPARSSPRRSSRRAAAASPSRRACTATRPRSSTRAARS